MSTGIDAFRTDGNPEPERAEREWPGFEAAAAQTAESDGFPALDDHARNAGVPAAEEQPASDRALSTGPDLPDSADPVESSLPEGVARPENLGGRDVVGGGEPLVAVAAREEFLSRWSQIQVSFVEDPATAVENADVLLQEIGAAMLASFEDRSGEFATAGRAASDTEQLRLALRQYHAFIGVVLPA